MKTPCPNCGRSAIFPVQSHFLKAELEAAEAPVELFFDSQEGYWRKKNAGQLLQSEINSHGYLSLPVFGRLLEMSRRRRAAWSMNMLIFCLCVTLALVGTSCCGERAAVFVVVVVAEKVEDVFDLAPSDVSQLRTLCENS